MEPISTIPHLTPPPHRGTVPPMTNEQQRIAIARVLGWKSLPDDPEMIQYTAQQPDGKWALIPDYPNDLNACHVMEEHLRDNPDDEYAYGEMLARMTIGMEMYDEDGFVPNGWGYFAVARATAAQRAEAFLRTLKLWTGGPSNGAVGTNQQGESTRNG